MLQSETHEATIYENDNGTKAMHAPYQNKQYFYLQFFQTALTGKQIIASPLNKDHHATYHQVEVFIP